MSAKGADERRQAGKENLYFLALDAGDRLACVP
jgi:hypothetical protein